MCNSGVYEIVNRVNKKKYIGSSSDLVGREYAHFHTLRNNCHHNVHLQNAWNKYGSNVFVFQHIEYHSNRDDWIRREQFHINKYNLHTQLYNICPVAGSPAYGGDLDSPKNKPVVQLHHKTGEILGIYRSMSDAEAVTGILKTHISAVCNPQRPRDSAGGFLWLYESDCTDELIYSARNRVVHQFRKKPVVKIDIKQQKIIEKYESTREATRSLNRSSSSISDVCNEVTGYRTYCGFLWMYEQDASLEEIQRRCQSLKNLNYTDAKIAKLKASTSGNRKPRKVLQFNVLDFSLICQYDSVNEAAKQFKPSPEAIRKSCLRYSKTSAGYIWRYADDAEDILKLQSEL